MIKNIIFDIDGTLADTSADIISSFNYSLKKNGFKKKINFQNFKKIANKGSLYLIQKVIGKKNIHSKKYKSRAIPKAIQTSIKMDLWKRL